MKFISKIILIIVTAGLISLTRLPWWMMAVIPFISAFIIDGNGWSDFLAGFIGIAILWGGVSYWISVESDGLLTNKLATLFQLESGNSIILIAALIGGLVGGMGGISGFQVRKIFSGRKSNS